MKNWEMPVMEELTIEATAQGGQEHIKIDNNFYDNGFAYSSYAEVKES